MKTKIALLLLCSMLLSCSGLDKSHSVKSPNGRLELSISQDEDGDFAYDFKCDKSSFIEKSKLGFIVNDSLIFPSSTWKITDVSRQSVATKWNPLWGKRKEVKDCYNEIILSLANEQEEGLNALVIALRAYDDGVAFRYSLPEQVTSEVKIKRERTQFNFAGDYTAWFYNGEQHNIGPERLTQTDKVRKPVMTIKTDEDKYLAIHEAYLQNGEPMTLTSKSGETLFEVASSPQTITGGYQGAWRVIFYGDTPGAMVDSHLLELLNPDPDPEMDFSWVEPSVAVWDWRINGAKVDDFTYTMSYPSWVKMVDFAAEQGMKYLVLDANWYGPEFDKSSDPLIGDKANDVKRLIAYGKERGVGIWLYLNDVGGNAYPIEQTLKQYGDWGAAGVKYGFMRGKPIDNLKRTQMITRLCAENHLLIDYHDGPIHPYGQMRTWPNAVTREYCHAQLDAHRVFQPETFVTTVFVNMIAGPIDMNNGMFDLRQGNTDRVDESQPVPSTLCSEAARTLIVFSGATILPDIPEFYRKHPALLRFISSQKMPWVESKTLSGAIGEHIVMMRETESHYLVAAAINEDGGELEIPLSFLGKGEYKAELTTDGAEAHYLTHRESIVTKEISLKAGDPLKVKLAPGGGMCLLIKK